MGLVAVRALLAVARPRRVRPVGEAVLRHRTQRLRHVQRILERAQDQRAGREDLVVDATGQGDRRRVEHAVGGVQTLAPELGYDDRARGSHCYCGGAHGADLQQRSAWDLDTVDLRFVHASCSLGASLRLEQGRAESSRRRSVGTRQKARANKGLRRSSRANPSQLSGPLVKRPVVRQPVVGTATRNSNEPIGLFATTFRGHTLAELTVVVGQREVDEAPISAFAAALGRR